MSFSMVTLVNCCRISFEYAALSVMVVVRQVPTFKPCSANTSFKTTSGNGEGVGVGVSVGASVGVGVAASVGVALGVVFFSSLHAAKTPIMDRTSRHKTIVFFMRYSLSFSLFRFLRRFAIPRPESLHKTSPRHPRRSTCYIISRFCDKTVCFRMSHIILLQM